ncbi:2OG-Fe(II) oxygenase [Actinosynnema sp. NPDC050801]|uniref:2OG-Fe(II) oxygenase n=1 Tax=unclassified Actinosynnema TaxID=2637065 RepID=UPI0033E95D6C
MVELCGKTVEPDLLPFRHFIVDDLWESDLLTSVLDEFPDESDDRWIRYASADTEEKLEGPETMFGPATRRLVRMIAEIGPDLSSVFAMPPLRLSTEGGGYHQTNPGGGLAVHADFNRSEDGLYRRVNVIIYLNRRDQPVEGGELQLWDLDGPRKHVVPQFNRTLVFETSDHSFHGHPEPLRGVHPRRSFAAYFFSAEQPDGYSEEHSTIWHPRGMRTP